jgi:hypothetical protein
MSLLLIGQYDVYEILHDGFTPTRLMGGRFNWYISICLLVAACYFASIREKNDRLSQKALSTSKELKAEEIATESDATTVDSVQTEREQSTQ